MADTPKQSYTIYWLLRLAVLLFLAFHAYVFVTGVAMDILGTDDDSRVGPYAWGAAIAFVVLYSLFRALGPRHLDSTVLLGLLLVLDNIALLQQEPLVEVWGLTALSLVFIAATAFYEVRRHRQLTNNDNAIPHASESETAQSEESAD